MKRLLISHVLVVLLAPEICLPIDSPLRELNANRWSEEKIWAWYNQQPWLVGCNFIPSTAVNQLEMWQAETFDTETIDRELGWAADIGFNIIRVFLHDMLWQQDAEGFMKRIDQFLAIAGKHNIKVMFVLFDSCWNPFPQLGKQPEPKPHLHNSGWVQSPHIDVLRDPAKHDQLRDYVKGVISRYRADSRILVWDIYNEPGNTNDISYGAQEPANKPELTLALLRKSFTWARQVNPQQPLTSGVWTGQWERGSKVSRLNEFMLGVSDAVTFHSYSPADQTSKLISALKPYKRPLICTEYMSRGTGCTFQNALGLFKQHRIGAINWGLVAGKTQTQYPWESWTKKYTAEPTLWFHDILRPDGTAFDEREVGFIREITKSNKLIQHDIEAQVSR